MADKKRPRRQKNPSLHPQAALEARVQAWLCGSAHPRLRAAAVAFGFVFLSRLLLAAAHMAYAAVTGDERTTAQALCIFDAGWYSTIIQGEPMYQLQPTPNGEANWAFFPGMPLLFRFLTRFIPLDLSLLGALVNSLLFALALLVAIRYIAGDGGSALQGCVFAVLAAVGPYTFYFSSLYTESLFLLLLLSCFYLLKRRRYLLMGLCGAALSATRNVGVLFVFAILADQIQRYLEAHPKGTRGPGAFCLYLLKQPRLILGTVLVPAGLFAYMAYLQQHVGDGLAFTHVQVAWHRLVYNPLEVLASGLYSGWGLYYLAWVAGAAACLVFLWRARRFPEFTMALLLLLVPLTTSLYSIPRYIVGSGLCLLGLTDRLMKLRYRHRVPTWAALLLCALILSGILLTGWYAMEPMLA